MDGGELRRDRFRGCLLGLAAGDALGAPFEGRARVGEREVTRWAEATEPLRWTDDTHMTIGLATSLLACGGFDGQHAAAEFARNFDAEPWRGYGPGPPSVFAALPSAASWDEPARRLFDGEGSFGNGAAMRVAPVGLVFHHAFDTSVAVARASARVTHAHELGQQAAALQAAAVGRLVAAGPDAAAELPGEVRPAAPDPSFRRQLGLVTRGVASSWTPERAAAALGNGLPGVEAVPAALHAYLRHPWSLPDAVAYAIRLGGDTDTIASMAGALAGAALGEAALPAAWRARLEAAGRLVALADDLAELSWRLRPA